MSKPRTETEQVWERVTSAECPRCDEVLDVVRVGAGVWSAVCLPCFDRSPLEDDDGYIRGDLTGVGETPEAAVLDWYRGQRCPICQAQGHITADHERDLSGEWIAACESCADYDIAAGTGATEAEAIATFIWTHRKEET